MTELFYLYVNDNNFQFGDLEALVPWMQQLSPNNLIYAPQNDFGSGGNREILQGEFVELGEPCSGTGNYYAWEEDIGNGFYPNQYTFNPAIFNPYMDTDYRLKVSNQRFPLLTLYSGVFHVDMITDEDILDAFFHYNGGIDWYDKTNWLTNNINSTWYGITWGYFNQSRHVTEIILPHNNLTGSLYPGLSKLAYLRVLDVSGNELTFSDDDGEFLLDFERLQYLILNGNKIENIPNLEPLLSNPYTQGPFFASVVNNRLEFDDLQNQPLLWINQNQGLSYYDQAKINEPYTLTGFAGGTFNLTVETPGNDLFYQWYIDPEGNNTPLANGLAYEGVHTSTLTIKDLPSGVTKYTCRVTNNSLPQLILIRETITIDASAFDINSTISWYVSSESSSNSMNNAINVLDFNEAGLASVNVYSGNANTGVFSTKLGTIDLTGSTSGYTFSDANSDPTSRAYVYKLSAVDNSISGTESSLSDYQQSVHLTVNLGLGNARNMLWTPYVSENGLIIIDSYDVMGGSTMDINSMSLIANLPGNLTSYTDNGNHNYYAIVTNLVGIPQPLKSGGMFLKSKSNIFATNEISYMPSISKLVVYPNPAQAQATFTFENPDNLPYTLKICDINGRTCLTQNNITNNQHSFDVTNLPPGLYIVQLAGERMFMGKIVVE